MAQPKITFNIGEGGLGRPLTGKDHISGLIWWHTGKPASWAATDEMVFYSIDEVEAAGVTEGIANFDVLWYQASEFFRLNPKGVLYIGIYDVPVGAYDFNELVLMQNYANGDIRQFAIWQNLQAWDVTELASIQTKLDTLLTEYRPATVLFSADFNSVTLGTLEDLTGYSAEAVSVCIGQDGDAKGAALATAKTYSIPTLGAQLGVLSKAKVSDSIAWVGKFPLVTGDELKVPALATGAKVSDQATSLLDTLNDKGYTFIKKFIGRENTYFNNSFTSTASTSDFRTLENNRTIQKSVRDIYVRSLDLLNSPIQVNADGTLPEDTIQTFRTKAVEALDQMAANAEISAFEVSIDPNQDVLATSQIDIGIKIVPIGVAREIVYNIGFTTNIS